MRRAVSHAQRGAEVYVQHDGKIVLVALLVALAAVWFLNRWAV